MMGRRQSRQSRQSCGRIILLCIAWIGDRLTCDPPQTPRHLMQALSVESFHQSGFKTEFCSNTLADEPSTMCIAPLKMWATRWQCSNNGRG
ncbi:uncharacterized protein GGS25DRAFT_478947 [Hypoxylon fragiforme]|uniref:uncharacterized protein n=1 Tax=Hypoxylon fragiforme TaxID=63214 RepID=UPI0020C6DB86|nr:uncharacterized protein GGS25DRAFT_478947 [Hypoxylon fragiforme]KAI2613206.1 hypothetical protein GGS25DRAFT_478947 [Hypoxylon fragiforme]